MRRWFVLPAARINVGGSLNDYCIRCQENEVANQVKYENTCAFVEEARDRCSLESTSFSRGPGESRRSYGNVCKCSASEWCANNSFQTCVLSNVERSQLIHQRRFTGEIRARLPSGRKSPQTGFANWDSDETGRIRYSNARNVKPSWSSP